VNKPSRLRKTASSLSESIHQQLNMYAIAAGAAGVGVLALAQPSEAKIIYTPANVRIDVFQDYGIDFSHDGTPDVVIRVGCFYGGKCFLHADPAKGNGIEESGAFGYAAALKAGANIGHTKQFNFASGVQMEGAHGHWHYAQARYLGVEIKINGMTHFGWAQFKNSSNVGAILTGYAYETIAGKSIKAGQKKEAADDPTNENSGPDASLTSSIPDTLHPATLGMLALGAQGVYRGGTYLPIRVIDRRAQRRRPELPRLGA
jgi:hypothetical protein